MYTTAGLLDIHERTHRSVQGVLDHLATLPDETIRRPVDGFSYPTLASQIHHLLTAERYWVGVLQGDSNSADDSAEFETVAALRGLREGVAAATTALLESYTDEEASTPRTVTKWTGDVVDLVPAHVLLRTQTHAYQHHGEIASMLRQLGHTFPSGLDFPVV